MRATLESLDLERPDLASHLRPEAEARQQLAVANDLLSRYRATYEDPHLYRLRRVNSPNSSSTKKRNLRVYDFKICNANKAKRHSIASLIRSQQRGKALSNS